MWNFLHRIWNPHCEHCREEAQNQKICQTCETLKQLLDVEKHENRLLLERILREPEVIESKPHEMPQPLMPKNIASVRVRREMLEAEDHKRAQILYDKQKEIQQSLSKGLESISTPQIMPKSIEELEKELGVTNAS